ncbi:MAG: transcription termination factor Rho [Trueperaceae bacterium]|nr:transcription termination factor Rho [Trueperaceae bacterium]
MSPRTRKTPEAATADTSETAAPKRRGRPPKAAPEPEAAAVAPEAEAVTPKRRGRPPKAASAPEPGAVEASEAPAKTRKKRSPAGVNAATQAEAVGSTDQPEREAAPSRVVDERADAGGGHDVRADGADGADGADRADRADAADRDDRAEGTDRTDRGGREERGRRGRRGGGQRRVGFNFRDLQGKILPELHLLAKEVGLEEYRTMEKEELVLAVLERVAESEGLRVVQGYLEISSDGYGFLQESLLQHHTRSVIVSAGLIKQFRLRTGDLILGKARRPRDNERYGTLIRVEAVNGIDPFQASKRPKFDDLVPTFPDHKITLETGQEDLSARVIDLLAPIGRGQRGLIVAPPKAGKTTLLKAIAKSVVTNEPDIKVIVLLVDERPEEVTDFRESVTGVEVIASTFDEPPANHIRVAEFVHERARRIVEDGGHAMILLDSITRLARANNLVTPATGRTLSGGLDSNALHWPKRFLGAARNIRGGGSLSILATALVETGSRMDDVIFEEFKGTGNMELHLSRRLEERRIFPAIDILKSGTRREDLLLTEGVLAKMWLLRKVISDMDAAEAMEMLLSRLNRTKDNAEFMSTLGQG